MENVNIDCTRYKNSNSPKEFGIILKKFKKKVNSSGVLSDYRDKMFFMTKKEKREMKRKRIKCR